MFVGAGALSDAGRRSCRGRFGAVRMEEAVRLGGAKNGAVASRPLSIHLNRQTRQLAREPAPRRATV